jgi:SAM-dependent methyltransferase
MPDHAAVVSAYTHAADTFDTLPFWHHYGRRTVELLHLAPGARVIDLCCGTGASALPAAEAVGPSGSVLGVDLTPALVDIARARAGAAGLAQARFVVADAATLDLPAGAFDAVFSVFGLFFLDDIPGMLRRAALWLRPGGRLASTVWGEVVLAPGERWFWEAVHAEDPALDHVSPAARLSTPTALVQAHLDAGLPAPAVRRERWVMPLASPDDFWPVIMGTSNRGVVEALPAEARARVKNATLTRLRDARIDRLTMEALVAVVERP